MGRVGPIAQVHHMLPNCRARVGARAKPIDAGAALDDRPHQGTPDVVAQRQKDSRGRSVLQQESNLQQRTHPVRGFVDTCNQSGGWSLPHEPEASRPQGVTSMAQPY